jgi:DNA-binding NarL/FixJ family response regulator
MKTCLPRSEPIMKPVRLAIFDDVKMTLDLYLDAFGCMKNVALVHHEPVNSMGEAFFIFRKFRPEIVITDFNFHEKYTSGTTGDGILLLNEIRRISPSAIVALCTLSSSSDQIAQIGSAHFDRVFGKVDIAGMESFIKEKIAQLRPVSSP